MNNLDLVNKILLTKKFTKSRLRCILKKPSIFQFFEMFHSVLKKFNTKIIFELKMDILIHFWPLCLCGQFSAVLQNVLSALQLSSLLNP